MKVSVVTVCYNAVEVIEKTILSVVNQTYNNLEYIIIDGMSTDGTVDIIKKYEDRITYWISEPDRGIYDAMNKGIKAATGMWINFMNAGDTFTANDILEKLYHVKLSSDIRVLYGDNIRQYNTGKRGYHKGHSIKKIKYRLVGCHQSIFVSLINKDDLYFETKYEICADYNQIYNIYLRYGAKAFLYVSFPIAVYDVDNGISSISKQKCQIEKLNIHFKNRAYMAILFDLLMLVSLKLRLK